MESCADGLEKNAQVKASGYNGQKVSGGRGGDTTET